MVKEFKILEKASKDPQIFQGLVCLTRESYLTIQSLLKNIPEENYISEWKEGLFHITYSYRVHNQTTGKALQDLIEKNIRGGHPQLIWAQKKNQLEKFILEGVSADLSYT